MIIYVVSQEDKIDPDQPLAMKMDYELLNNTGLELISELLTLCCVCLSLMHIYGPIP